MTSNRYIRLMILAISDMLINVPMCMLALILFSKQRLYKELVTWDIIHSGFNTVVFYGADHYKANQVSIEIQRWIYPFGAILFFLIFGLTQEARSPYTSVVHKAFARLPQYTSGVSSWRQTMSRFVFPSKSCKVHLTYLSSQRRSRNAASTMTESSSKAAASRPDFKSSRTSSISEK